VALLAGLLARHGARAHRRLLLPAAPPERLLRLGSAALLHDSVVLRKEAAALLAGLAAASCCAAAVAPAAGLAAPAPEPPGAAAGGGGALGELRGLLLRLCAGGSAREWEGACELLCACCEAPGVSARGGGGWKCTALAGRTCHRPARQAHPNSSPSRESAPCTWPCCRHGMWCSPPPSASLCSCCARGSCPRSSRRNGRAAAEASRSGGKLNARRTPVGTV
jgi:hypothetical protein